LGSARALWDFTQRRVVAPDVSLQSIGPVFKGQADFLIY